MRKPFNLQEYLKHPEWELETQIGEPAKIVFTEGMGNRPVLAVIWDGDTTDASWYSKEGKDFRGAQGLYFKNLPDENPV